MEDLWDIVRTVVVVILGIPLIVIALAIFIIYSPFCYIFKLTPTIKLAIGKSEYQ